MAYKRRKRVGLVIPPQDVQVTLTLSDAMISCAASAVDTSFALHNRRNGSTVSLVHGSLENQRLFSVSIYPTHTIELWDRPTWQELFEFTKANLDLLTKPDHALGTWFNDWEQVHVLDVVVCIADRATALDLGLRFHQQAIFDLSSRREIQIARSSDAFLLSGGGVSNG